MPDKTDEVCDIFSHERYRLLELIGEGAYSRVYKAEHKLLGDIFAIKVLKKEYFAQLSEALRSDSHGAAAAAPDSKEAVRATERFKREARLAMQLQHPNIVSIRGLGFTSNEQQSTDQAIEDSSAKDQPTKDQLLKDQPLKGQSTKDQPFIVMEYCDGLPLDKVLEQSKTLPVEETLSIAKQLVSALSHAHNLNIIHRDIKPGNILVLQQGESNALPAPAASSSNPKALIKLVDFGLAKESDPTPGGLTTSSSFAGTPNYMSPEQCCNKVLDARSDIYSLGCVLYECLTGRKVFSADSDLALMDKHLRETPAFLRTDPPDASLRNIILKCLQKNPDQRYQSAADLQADLNNVSASSSGKKHNFALLLLPIAIVALLILAGPSFLAFIKEQRAKHSVDADTVLSDKKKKASDLESHRLGYENPNTVLEQGRNYRVDKPGRLHNYAEAERLMKRARMISQKIGNKAVAARSLSDLAYLYTDIKRLDDAEAALNELLPELETVDIDMPKGKTEAYICYGNIEYERNNFKNALSYYKKSLACCPLDTAKYSYIRRVIAKTHLALGECDTAKKIALENEKAIRDDNSLLLIGEKTLTPFLIAEIDLACKNFAEADKRIDLIFKNYNEFNRDTIGGLNKLAAVALKVGRLEEAEALARHALKLIEVSYREPGQWNAAKEIIASAQARKGRGNG